MLKSTSTYMLRKYIILHKLFTNPSASLIGILILEEFWCLQQNSAPKSKKNTKTSYL